MSNNECDSALEDLEAELMQCLSQHTPAAARSASIQPEALRDLYVLDLPELPPREPVVQLVLPEIPERPTSEARETPPRESSQVHHSQEEEADVAIEEPHKTPLAPVDEDLCLLQGQQQVAVTPNRRIVSLDKRPKGVQMPKPSKASGWGEEEEGGLPLKDNTGISNQRFEPRRTNPFDQSLMLGHLKPKVIPLLNKTSQALRNAPEKLSQAQQSTQSGTQGTTPSQVVPRASQQRSVEEAKRQYLIRMMEDKKDAKHHKVRHFQAQSSTFGKRPPSNQVSTATPTPNSSSLGKRTASESLPVPIGKRPKQDEVREFTTANHSTTSNSNRVV